MYTVIEDYIDRRRIWKILTKYKKVKTRKSLKSTLQEPDNCKYYQTTQKNLPSRLSWFINTVNLTNVN